MNREGNSEFYLIKHHFITLFFLQLNYKAKYEETKFKSSLPPDYPFFIQSRVNAFNLSDVSNFLNAIHVISSNHQNLIAVSFNLV